jgi:hypothetical protein
MPQPVKAVDFAELSRKVLFAQNEGRFSGALDLIDEFKKRPGAAEYARKLEDLVATTGSKATAGAAAALRKSQDLLDRSDKTAALQVLDRSASDFRRFPKETTLLEAQRRKITPR